MPDHRRANCLECKGHRDEVGPISWSGYCAPCGERLMVENIVGLAEHSGEPMRRWRVGMILCAGGLTPDDLRQAV